MKTFEQFLTEGRDAPLYHATKVYSVIDIWHQGIMPKTKHQISDLMGKQNKPPYKLFNDTPMTRGVSATRERVFAKKWAPVILVLDQKMLTQKYPIVPVQYWQGHGRKGSRPYGGLNEFEEFIVTNLPIPRKFITKVFILKDAVTDDYLQEIIDTWGKDMVELY